MKSFCFALVAVPVALIICTNTAWGQRSPESVTIIKEFEFGDFRFQTYSTTTGKVKVWTVGFAGNTEPGAETSEVSQKTSASREKVE